MADKQPNLSEDDIDKLMQCPVKIRRDAAKHISLHYRKDSFTDGQKDTVEKLFRALLKDNDQEVRSELAKIFQDCGKIPKDIILYLAQDIISVAAPVLEKSEQLEENDLIDIVKKDDTTDKCIAISSRQDVTEKVSEELINKGEKRIVSSLLKNQTAQISDQGYSNIIDKYSETENIVKAVVERTNITQEIVKKLTQKLSTEMLTKVEQSHKENFEKHGIDLEQEKKTALTVNISDQEDNICAKARESGVPMDMLALFALCMGNVDVFSVMSARNSEIDKAEVDKLITTEEGFQQVCEKSGLPEKYRGIAFIMSQIIQESADQPENIAAQLANKLAETIDESHAEFPQLEYVTGLISQGNAE